MSGEERSKRNKRKASGGESNSTPPIPAGDHGSGGNPQGQIVLVRELDKALNTFNRTGRHCVGLNMPRVVEILSGATRHELGAQYIGKLYHRAAWNGWIELLELLISRFPEDINAQSPKGETALLLAALRGVCPTATLLLRAGADQTLEDMFGRTAFYWACVENFSTGRAIEAFVDSPHLIDTTDSKGRTPIYHAASHNAELAVHKLLERGFRVNGTDTEEGETALFKAVSYGNARLVRELLAAGAEVGSVSKDGWTPLHKAVARNDAAIVQIFLHAGADATRAYKKPLMALAVESADLDNNCLDLLWTAGARPSDKPDGKGNTFLHLFAKETCVWPHIVRFKHLVDERNAEGLTPLALAVRAYNMYTITPLVELGSNPNVPLDGKVSLLDYAAYLAQDENVFELLKFKETDPFRVAHNPVNDVCRELIEKAQHERMCLVLAAEHWLAGEEAEQAGACPTGVAALPMLCMDMLFEELGNVYHEDGPRILCVQEASDILTCGK